MDILTKRMVSLRIEEKYLAMLEQVQEAEGTMYWQRDRTWLIENAIRLAYAPFVEKLDKREAAPSAS